MIVEWDQEPEPLNKPSALNSLQVLRGFAATAVVCHHSMRTLTMPMEALPAGAIVPAKQFVKLGAIGVDVFFILSGFLMVYISKPYAEGCKGSGDFLRCRFIRIWPLYAFVTLLKILPALSVYLQTGKAAFDLEPFRLASFLFIPSFDQQGIFAPIFGIGWTLVYEMYFYLCFTAAILLARRHIFPVVVALICTFYAVAQVLPQESGVAVFFNKDIVFEFLLGGACALLIRRVQLPVLGGVVAGVLGLLSLAYLAMFEVDIAFRTIKFGVPAFLLFFAVLSLNERIKWPPVLKLVGDASYSIYMFHMFVVTRLSVVLLPIVAKHVTATYSVPITVIVVALLSVGLGICGYFLIEKPVTRAAQRLLLPNRKPQPKDVQPAVSGA